METQLLKDFREPKRAHAREARCSQAFTGHTRCWGQADVPKSGDQIMSLIGFDQSEPDKPRDPVALHLDEKPQRSSDGAEPLR